MVNPVSASPVIVVVYFVASTPDITQDLADEFYARELARKNKDYAVADKIRDDLLSRNLTILDTADGPIWQMTA